MKTKKLLTKALLIVPFLFPSFVSAQNTSVPPAAQHNLMPVPASVRFLEGRVVVDKTFAVATKGHTDARLQSAIQRFLQRLKGRTVLSITPGITSDVTSSTLVIQCSGPGNAL